MAATLQNVIQHMKKHPGTWIAPASDVARWCHDEVNKLKARHKQLAKAS